MSMDVIPVSALVRAARETLEARFALQWVAGETSNLVRAASGHVYFTLKDDQAQARCVMFRNRAQLLPWRLENGMHVEALALVSLYEARGDFQLNVENLRQAGVGRLFEAFERLRRRLEAEGLFAADRKRRLPTLPRRIGIVTSPRAAALRDVLAALARRAPHLPVVLYPTAVQGEDAGRQIADALAAAGRRAECDVLLLVRGGGSLEDLWSFNEEVVARAVAGCPVPVISGVGHETDTSIADFVADLRAPTPTAAAEMATPDRVALARHLSALLDGLETVMGGALADRREGLDWLQRRLDHLSPARQIAEHRRRTFDLQRRAHQTMQHRLTLAQARLAGQASRLIALDPYAVLSRGYAIVTDADTGAVVSSSRQVRAGRGLRVRVADGEFDATAGRQRRLLEE